MKRLAVVASGWHFPLHFFERIAAQKIPDGWSVDLFCISHRDPSHGVQEKRQTLEKLGYDRRALYDRLLYANIATVPALESLGWKYILEPNHIGDMGNVNQWLERNDYRAYDKFLFTHDDNFILTDRIFLDVLPQDDWLILTNSDGHAKGLKRTLLGIPKEFSIRGSFEFFTREMMDILGGKFEMSAVTLTREGEVTTGEDFSDLSDWNNTTTALFELIEKKKLQKRVKPLSKFYRMSIYCLEGERGFIHKTEALNTKEEDRGLDAVERFYSGNA